MKKKVLALITVTAMAVSLAACGGESSSTSSTTAAAAGNSSGSSGGSNAAAAAGWEPTGTVSIVVPAGAGGDTDLTARIFAQYAKEKTGHDFVVVNASGASGSVAANQVLQSDANGETFLYGHALVNVANIAGVTDYNFTAFKLGPNFAKNPAQQFYVNSSTYSDLDSFIAAAKAAPGQLKACTEVGAYTYYELLALEKAADIDLDLIDAGSNSEKIAAMLGGQVDLMPGAYMSNKEYIESGQFACLGAPVEENYEMLSSAGIKTMKEQGIDLVYPDCDYSFYFPAGTPDEVITFYDTLVEELVNDEACAKALTDMDVIPYYLNHEDAYANDENVYNTIKGIADSLQ